MSPASDFHFAAFRTSITKTGDRKIAGVAPSTFEYGRNRHL